MSEAFDVALETDQSQAPSGGWVILFHVPPGRHFRGRGSGIIFEEGDHVGPTVWPSRDVAETRAAEWLAATTHDGLTFERAGYRVNGIQKEDDK